MFAMSIIFELGVQQANFCLFVGLVLGVGLSNPTLLLGLPPWAAFESVATEGAPAFSLRTKRLPLVSRETDSSCHPS
jgi:hypothetical protein